MGGGQLARSSFSRCDILRGAACSDYDVPTGRRFWLGHGGLAVVRAAEPLAPCFLVVTFIDFFFFFGNAVGR